MSKKINIKKMGKVDASTNIKGSEMDAESFDALGDIDIQADSVDDLNASTNVEGSKIQKQSTFIILAAFAALVAIAGYYFSQSSGTVTEPEKTDRFIHEEDDAPRLPQDTTKQYE